jgi:hypothetical protein
MSDLASLFYPSMAPAAPEQPAQATPSPVASMYPSMVPESAAAQPAPAAAPVAPVAEQPHADEALHLSMYGETPPTTHAPVNWQEGAARPGDYDLTGAAEIIGDTRDTNHQALRSTLAEAGIGSTAGAELYRHVAEVAAIGGTFDPADTMQTLRQVWGSQTDARVAAVQAAVARLPAEARAALDRTGAGNDPALIRKAWAALNAAQQRGK